MPQAEALAPYCSPFEDLNGLVMVTVGESCVKELPTGHPVGKAGLALN